ncbi:MAG: restriction endonuclease subunit S [Taibaiella sp.]|nr:restriction endonuclease subunit S [Taibaiella sp.]
MNWEMKKLGEVVNNLDNRRVPLNDIQRQQKESNMLYPYVGANNILGYIDEYIFDEKILCIAEDGGNWGKGQKCCFIIDQKCWVNNHAHVVTARQNASLEYLRHYLNFSDLSKYITGTTRGKLTRSALDSIPIPLPPLPIQQKIAAILDEADALRRKDKALLAKYDELLQAVFYDMFGDPVKNEKEWEVKNLGSVTTMLGGGTPNTSRPEYFDGNIPWVSPKDMKAVFINNSIDKITELAVAESSTKMIDSNAVLMVVRSGILKKKLPVAINTVPVALNQDMKAIVCNKELDPIFLMIQLQMVSGQLLQTVRGTTADNLSTDVIKRQPLVIPKISQQKHFASVVKNIELQKSQIVEQQAYSEDLFQSLMQRAFKGELVG